MWKPCSRAALPLLAACTLAAGCAGQGMMPGGSPGTGKEASQSHPKPDVRALQKAAPYRGYLEAHSDEERPLGLLGGPLEVEIAQKGGGVFVALPDFRELDPNVFGTPAMPRAFAGTPIVNGLPPGMRATEGGRYTQAKKRSPFGDKHMVLPGGELALEATDATATDGAVTRDKLKMQASWQDKAGNRYSVRCCAKLATHGVEFPTFGGVMTNHILHGSSRIGTALMPTEYTYLAFWGMGQVRKNGEVLDRPRLVHGMLTEYVRSKGYELGFDEDITPGRRHFHLMVAPVKPVMGEGRFKKDPVKTGFTLPNGKPLPFWHVMFENLDVSARRG